MAKPSLFTPEMIKKYTTEGFWKSVTFSDFWEKNAREHPDKVAISDSRTRLTWKEAVQLINRIALSFVGLGLEKDQVVVMQLPSCVELVLLHRACEKAGLLRLQAAYNLRQKEMAYILSHTEARVVVIPGVYRNFDYYEMMQELKTELPSLKHIVVWGEEIPPGGLSFREMLSIPLEKRYPEDYLKDRKIPATDFSLIGLTTGTTGLPKMVEIPACSLIASSNLIDILHLTGHDVLAVVTGAVLGPNVAAYNMAPQVAARVVILEHWTVEEGLKLFEKERVTVPCLVPTQLIEILSYPDLHKYDLGSIRVIKLTGAPLPYHVAVEAEKRLNCRIQNGYGTVDFGCISDTHIDDPDEVRHLTVGRPPPGNEIKIVDSSGNGAGAEEVGEILTRGPCGFSGYYKDPETTAKCRTRDGWYKTGDLGKIDRRGFLSIVGRAKEMIIRGGQNIYPIEIENILLTHPKVLAVGIVGIPDPFMGERCCACVVSKSGESFTFEEMIQFLKGEKIAAYKLPEKFIIFDSLPFVAGLKLDRKMLREEAMKRLK